MREEDFKKPAREKCSTVCTVLTDKNEIDKAHMVLFHVKTHNPPQFPAKSSDKQKVSDIVSWWCAARPLAILYLALLCHFIT